MLHVFWNRSDKAVFRLKSQTHNKTQGIFAYTFHSMKGSSLPHTFTIIDAPGFGATERFKKDKKITEQI